MLKDTFSNIIREMNKNDSYCQGASQQMANGFYRIFDALAAISAELDESGTHSASVRSIRSTLNTNNSFCQGAPQQCANGSYRIVEILKVIITQLDKDGTFASKTSAIIQEMNRNNSFCQGAPQQTANGAYRIVDMLDIIARIVAPSKSSDISSCISSMNRNNSFCQGAPQQSANGTDAAFIILQHIIRALDTKNKYGSDLSNISMLKARNNGYCQGADQQSANNLYRIMESIQVLGRIFSDWDQERIEAYWNEHQDLRDSLMAEKKECQNKIAEIKKRANAIHANDAIAELKQQITVLQNDKQTCGASELQALQDAIKQRTVEHSQIGFFKFSLRKEASAKIDAAKATYSSKFRDVEAEKDKIQKQIDGLNKQIDGHKKDVSQKQAAVLKECDPHQKRINSIDHELTKKR